MLGDGHGVFSRIQLGFQRVPGCRSARSLWAAVLTIVHDPNVEGGQVASNLACDRTVRRLLSLWVAGAVVGWDAVRDC